MIKSWLFKIVPLLALVMTPSLQAGPPYTIPNTTSHILSTDTTTNRDYRLYVHLPDGYEAQARKRYPVLYLLDPWWDFPVIAGAYSGLVFDEVIPELIIVGIDYERENPDYDTLREKDYSPAAIEGNDNTGDGPAFLQFIESAVIPLIEQTYRVDDYSVLAGTSYGGLFSLFTMFEKPELFDGLIAITPAVSWKQRWIFQREASFYEQHLADDDLKVDVRLYMSVGEKDQLDNFTNESIAFSQLIKDRPYEGFEFRFEVRANEHHASVKLGSFSQGLQHAFSGYH